MYRFDTLPDVTSDRLENRSVPLRWVGMEQIDVPLDVSLETGRNQITSAKADVFVSLDDVKLCQAWLNDLVRLGYRFPPITGAPAAAAA